MTYFPLIWDRALKIQKMSVRDMSEQIRWLQAAGIIGISLRRMRSRGFGHTAFTNAGVVLLCAVLGAGETLGGSPANSLADTVRKAADDDPAAQGEIEARLESFTTRKDLNSLDTLHASMEVRRLLGKERAPPDVHWWPVSIDDRNLRVLAIDFGDMVEDSGARGSGYVVYAIVREEPHPHGARATSNVYWYHDTGRKLEDQGGAAWHPMGTSLLGGAGSGEAAALAMIETVRPGAKPSGLLVFDLKADGKVVADRIAPGAVSRDARLLGFGAEGAVFIGSRDPPRGVLSGARQDLFRSLILYERRGGSFAREPIVIAAPDVVTAAESLIAAVRRGDKAEAARLCTSPDVLEAMLYFSPEWKGGGKVIRADASKLEIVYEERERPTLRIEFTFSNVGGALVLSSVTGRAEGARGLGAGAPHAWSSAAGTGQPPLRNAS